MNKIDEIALRVGRNINVYPWGESKDFYIKFAHTLLADPELLAELSKDVEPVAWINARGDYVELATKSTVYGSHTIPLFTHPSAHDQSEIEPALKRYNAHMEGELEPEPIERLRFFLSLALTGQDWLDVEQFINALPKQSEIEQRVAVPDGWLIEKYGDWEIKLTNPDGERWNFRDVCHQGGVDGFIYSLLKAMMSAAPKKN